MAKQTNQEMMFPGWWNGWDYVENNTLVSSGSESEGVQSVTIDSSGNLVVDGNTVGAVAAGSILDRIEVSGTTLVISYHTEDDTTTKTAEVDLSEFVDTYTAKENGGIIVDAENKEISVDTTIVALIEDIPDVSGYITKETADATYQPIGEYATEEELSAVEAKIPDTSDYLTKEDAEATYQPKGTYVQSVELSATNDANYELLVDGNNAGGFTIPSTESFVTKDELQAVEAEIPTEYVKDVELTSTDNNVYTLKVDDVEKGGFTIPDTSNLLDKETADETYQPKGNYISNVSLDTTDNNVYTLTVDGEEKGGFTLPSTDDLATEDEVKTISTQVEENKGQIASLQAMVDILTAQVTALSQTNVVSVDLSNLTGNLTDETADYVLSGTLSSTATIAGKSITLDDSAVVSNDNRLNLKANDVTINGTTISGEYVKSNGNSVIKIDECENVVIKNLTFDDTYSGYNGIEIGLTQGGTIYPKNILVDNCEIGGTFSNNAINVYATADDATVIISNCHFANVSNCLRISNTQKASGVVFKVVNCTVDQWEHTEGNEAYYGFFLGQDYTSSTEEEATTNNLFGQDKITLNFVNLVHGGEKVCPSDPYSVCGIDDGTQVVYTYADKHGKWYATDNKEMYPVVTFE